MILFPVLHAQEVVIALFLDRPRMSGWKLIELFVAETRFLSTSSRLEALLRQRSSRLMSTCMVRVIVMRCAIRTSVSTRRPRFGHLHDLFCDRLSRDLEVRRLLIWIVDRRGLAHVQRRREHPARVERKLDGALSTSAETCSLSRSRNTFDVLERCRAYRPVCS